MATRGRPSKGARDGGFMVRPAREIGDAVRREADARGMYYGEFIAAILAEHYGKPGLTPMQPVRDELGGLQRAS